MDSKQTMAVIEELQYISREMEAIANRAAGTPDLQASFQGLADAYRAAVEEFKRVRVRETAKELPEGGYGDRVLAFDRRCLRWRDAGVGDIRFIERKRPGKGYYTHWMPLPPAPKEADDGK